MSYPEARLWADTFLDKQQKIIYDNRFKYDYNKIKENYIKDKKYTGFYYDKKADEYENTDLVFIFKWGLRFALRIRNLDEGIFLSKPNLREVTIRTRSKCGNETEINKIMNMYGHYMLYCWTSKKKNLFDYILFDLDDFRKNHLNWLVSENIPNKDDGTKFNAYKIDNINYIDKMIKMR